MTFLNSGVANLSSQGSGSNIGQRVIRIDNHDENTPLGIQVVAQYEKKRQPVLNKLVVCYFTQNITIAISIIIIINSQIKVLIN